MCAIGTTIIYLCKTWAQFSMGIHFLKGLNHRIGACE